MVFPAATDKVLLLAVLFPNHHCLDLELILTLVILLLCSITVCWNYPTNNQRYFHQLGKALIPLDVYVHHSHKMLFFNYSCCVLIAALKKAMWWQWSMEHWWWVLLSVEKYTLQTSSTIKAELRHFLCTLSDQDRTFRFNSLPKYISQNKSTL